MLNYHILETKPLKTTTLYKWSSIKLSATNPKEYSSLLANQTNFIKKGGQNEVHQQFGTTIQSSFSLINKS